MSFVYMKSAVGTDAIHYSTGQIGAQAYSKQFLVVLLRISLAADAFWKL